MTDINHIKNAVEITELVGETYELNGGQGCYRKAKQHDSLVVNTQKQAYYWNSKGESGDAIDWAGRHRLNYGLQWNSADPDMFKEALIWLAAYAGQPEPQFRPEDAQARARRLSAKRLMDLAKEHYIANFGEVSEAQTYAQQRGFTPETCAKAALGYSRGRLWRLIEAGDRPLAVELGLIYQTDSGRWRDAIPSGYLVYCHYHRGQVEYFAGRRLAKKQHRNIRVDKKMFWAVWAGYGGPLIISEGQADAISVAQLGVSGLGLCGVNLADFDPELVKLFNPIYIWPDAGQPETISPLAEALGPLIRLLTSPDTKDANEYLQAGATPHDLQDLMKSAPTYLDQEIERLTGLYGADLYEELEPLFTKLATLEIFPLNHYRTRVCKALQISQSDFNRYLKAAKGTLNDDDEAEFAKGGQYTVIDGWTVLRSFTEEGKQKICALANGTAQIVEEITKDDGSNDPNMDFLVAGELATGQKLPSLAIPATDYDSMKWTRKWGSRFILSAGRAVQDHFRAAVQHLSGTPYRRTIYTHTGWRRIDDKWIFLTSSGALGAPDEKIQVDLKMGRPDTNMTRYHLPLSPENISQAMQASLNFWHIADLSITVPLWAAMYLTPLTKFILADFGLWIHGQTGSLKSSIVATALAHFGQWQGKDAKILLPSNFQSTANNILMCAFQAKDVPLVIDDFAPGATQKEIRERDNTASNLLRSIGNKAARGRMRDGRNFQADFPPRCLAIITAEDLPKTASIMARGVGVRVHIPGKGNPHRRPIEKRLSQVQAVDSFFYPHAMAGFILWIQRHWEELEQNLPIMAASYRDKIQSAGHSRLPDAFGKLMAAVDTALYFALDCGALPQDQVKEYKHQAQQALGLMMSEHGEAVEMVDACRIFQDVLIEHLDALIWYLCPIDAGSITLPPHYPPGALCIGYQDDHFIYLLSKTVTEIIQAYQRLGTPFPVGRNTLYQRLMEKGWLISGSKKASSTIYIPALNTSLRVLKLKKMEVLGE